MVDLLVQRLWHDALPYRVVPGDGSTLAVGLEDLQEVGLYLIPSRKLAAETMAHWVRSRSASPLALSTSMAFWKP